MAKPTLSVDNRVVSRAKQYAKRRGVSISGMVEAYLAAVADPVLGHRLFGTAADPRAMQAALKAFGVNPLVVAAFDQRGEAVWRETLAAG